MRILMVGASHIIAMRRPLDWVLDSGHEVWLLDSWNPYPRTPPPNFHFVPSMAKNLFRFKLFWTKWARTNLVWLGAWQLRRLAASIEPDIIHAHNIHFSTDCCVRAGLKPLVVSVWSGLDSVMVSCKQPPLIRRTLKAADALIVESPYLQKQSSSLPNSPSRIDLIPLGTDPQHFSPRPTLERSSWRKALNIPEDTITLLSSRGWQERYCHHLILEAYAQAQPRFRQPTVLVFVELSRSDFGQASVYMQEVRDQAEQLGLAQQIRWLPALHHNLMPGLFATSDVMINYPSHDAFPSTLVEAAACETPVITSDLPSYRGTFIEEFFILVAPEQPNALAKAMVSVVNEASMVRRNARLKQLRQVIMGEYDEAIFKDRLLALYRELACG